MEEEKEEVSGSFSLSASASVQETPEYRMITTFNAQITKWGFCLLGFVIGFLLCLVIN